MLLFLTATEGQLALSFFWGGGLTRFPPLGSLLGFTGKILCEGKQHTMAHLHTHTQTELELGEPQHLNSPWITQMHEPHTTPTKYWAFLFRYVLHPLVRASKWGSWNNVPERPMEQPCFVQSWESESQFSSTPERADLGRLGSVLNRGEAGAEEQRGGMGRAALLHDTHLRRPEKHKETLLESIDIYA